MQIDSYSIQDLIEMSEEGQAPCHCTRCGRLVAVAEPDARWVGGDRDTVHCEECGPMTLIMSALVYHQVI